MADSVGDYQVGPGRPLLHTRFKKSQFGNPSGRGSRSLPALLGRCAGNSSSALDKVRLMP